MIAIHVLHHDVTHIHTYLKLPAHDVLNKRLQIINFHPPRSLYRTLSFCRTTLSIMTSIIPTSSSVTESTVIQAPLSAVWHLIKLQEFDKFWTRLEKSEHVNGTSPEAFVVKWTFKDGTVQEVKQEEHSVDIFSLLMLLSCRKSAVLTATS